MTYPLLVGKKRINIDPGEDYSKVVVLKGVLNRLLLDQEQYYLECYDDMQKQFSRFGEIKS